MGRSKSASKPPRKRLRSFGSAPATGTADACAPDAPPATIDSLPDSLLAQMFRLACPHNELAAQHSVHAAACTAPGGADHLFRLTLPLVCKRWRNILHGPCAVWEDAEITLSKADKVHHDDDDTDHLCFLASKIKAWFQPRASSVRKLAIRAGDKTQHSFPRSGQGLRPLFEMVPQLTSLSLYNLSDVVQGFTFVTIANLLPMLTCLRIGGIDTEIQTETMDPLAKLTGLKELLLTWAETTEEGAPGSEPEFIAHLTQLEHLSLHGDGLCNLLSSGASLTMLRTLDLSGTSMDFLPCFDTQLPKLHTLRLNNVPATGGWDLDSWSGLVSASQIKTLSLRGCGLSDVPSVFTKENTITNLDFSENSLANAYLVTDKLASLESLAEWLQVLSLDRCALSILPDAVCLLTRLTSLSLAGQYLVALPEALCQLTALQSLDMSSNHFPAVPEGLAVLPSLRSVDLSSNLNLELPTWSALEALSELTSLSRLLLTKGHRPYQSYSCKHIHQLRMTLPSCCIECKEADAWAQALQA